MTAITFHKNILKFQPQRLGSSVEEMNEILIQKWNERVKPQDEVWHLGDVSFGSIDQTEEILKRLNGRINLCLGNHDKQFNSKLKFLLSSMQDYKTIKLDGKHIVMSHFPFQIWDRKHYFAIHYHGHCHSHGPLDYNRLDVGVDTHPEMAPWSWEELKIRMVEHNKPLEHLKSINKK